MTKDSEEFLPEEGDAQNQQLVEDLRDLYGSGNTTRRSLTAMRERLQQNITMPHSGDMSAKNILPLQNQRSQRHTPMKSEPPRFHHGRPWQQRLGTLAAVFLTALLIGSLLLLLNRVQQSRTGSPQVPGKATVHATVVLQPTVFPTLTAPTGWQVLAHLGNAGPSTASNAAAFSPNAPWSALYNCVGSGKLVVQITMDSAYASQNNIPSMITYTYLCSPFAPEGTQTFPKPSSSVTIQVNVTTEGDVTWQALVMQCVAGGLQCAPTPHS